MKNSLMRVIFQIALEIMLVKLSSQTSTFQQSNFSAVALQVMSNSVDGRTKAAGYPLKIKHIQYVYATTWQSLPFYFQYHRLVLQINV